MLRQPAIVPDEVGQLYDLFTVLAPLPMSHNMHFGYWNDSDSDDLDGKLPFDEASDRLTDMMTERLKIGPESRVLDVGCGVGGPGVRIARRTGARVTGISVSQEQITLANAYAESVGLAERAVFQRANAMEIPFPDQSFDAAIALESIFHMPDRGQVLAQICRVLRPGGRLVLTDSFERAPIPADKQSAVEGFLNDFMLTMIQVEEYPPLLRQAGLWFEEILDISDQTVRKSFIWLSQQIGQAREGIKAMFNDDMDNRFDLTGMVDVPEFGYLMLAAKRPEK